MRDALTGNPFGNELGKSWSLLLIPQRGPPSVGTCNVFPLFDAQPLAISCISDSRACCFRYTQGFLVSRLRGKATQGQRCLFERDEIGTSERLVQQPLWHACSLLLKGRVSMQESKHSQMTPRSTFDLVGTLRCPERCIRHQENSTFFTRCKTFRTFSFCKQGLPYLVERSWRHRACRGRLGGEGDHCGVRRGLCCQRLHAELRSRAEEARLQDAGVGPNLRGVRASPGEDQARRRYR